MKLIFTLLLFVAGLLTSSCCCQTDTVTYPSLQLHKPYRETAIKILIGGHLQQAYNKEGKEYNRKYIEIGMHKTFTAFNPHHPSSMFTHGISLKVAPQRYPVFGFKYSTWAMVNCMVLGLGGIYYTNFDVGNFKIRPEIGIGMFPFKLTAGFNIPTIRNRDFKDMQRSNGQVTLTILLKAKTIKTV